MKIKKKMKYYKENWLKFNEYLIIIEWWWWWWKQLNGITSFFLSSEW